MYLQTDAEAHAETGSRPSSQVGSTTCRIPDRQTEWSTRHPNSVFYSSHLPTLLPSWFFWFNHSSDVIKMQKPDPTVKGLDFLFGL